MRRGLRGNQPFSTRFFCSKTSKIDQKQEKAKTPKMTEAYVLSANNENTNAAKPTNANTHQQRVPK